jgi:hypothetical protein
MPTLRQLLQELRRFDVSPEEIRLPAALYDDLVEQGEDIADEDQDSNESDD